jgi:hypothetical protein
MENLPSINRMAVIIKHKKPFIGWAKAQGDDDVYPLEDKHDTKSIYLIPEKDGADWDKYLKKYYLEIFENELEGWYNDPSTWPQDRSWKVFNEWLDFEVQTMVYDLIDEPVEKD